jgi:uncharacterized protein YsxB (DUF464 family)
MIYISIKRNKDNNNIKGFTVKGHAYAGKPGEDIVCSAISAIAYTAIGSLLNIAGGCEYTAVEGDMKCFLPEGISQEDDKSAQIILNTIYIGFKQVEESYGKYVSVCEEEV